MIENKIDVCLFIINVFKECWVVLVKRDVCILSDKVDMCGVVNVLVVIIYNY